MDIPHTQIGFGFVKHTCVTQRITNVQTFCSNADFTKGRKPIETKVNTFLFMYINSRDIIICYLELRKTRSVLPISLGFEISKFACIFGQNNVYLYNLLHFFLTNFITF